MSVLLFVVVVLAEMPLLAEQIPSAAVEIGEHLADCISEMGPLQIEGGQEQKGENIYDRLLGIGRGTTVEVELRDGRALTGRLGEVDQESFWLLVESDEWEELKVSDVRRIWIPPAATLPASDPTGGWGTKKSLIVAGSIVGVVVGIPLMIYLSH